MDRLSHPKTEVVTSRLDTETRTTLTAALTTLALPFSACHALPSAETTPETVTVYVAPPPERPAFNPDKPTDVSVTRVRTPEEATASLLSRDAIESKITTLSDAITNELPVEPFSLDSVDDVVLEATGTKEDATTPCYKKSDLNKTLRSQIDRNTAAHNPEIANPLTMLQLSAATPLCDVGGFAWPSETAIVVNDSQRSLPGRVLDSAGQVDLHETGHIMGATIGHEPAAVSTPDGTYRLLDDEVSETGEYASLNTVMGMKNTAPYFSTLDRAGVAPDSTIITRAEAPSLLPRDYLLSRQIGAVNGIDIMLPPDHPLRQLGAVDRITATIDADSQQATTCTPPTDQSRCEIRVYASDGSHRSRIALERDRPASERPRTADHITTDVAYLDKAANLGILTISDDRLSDGTQPIGVRVTDYATAQAQLDAPTD